MVYLGYDFSLPIIEGIDALPILLKESLSFKQSLEVAKAFLKKDVGAFIASALNLFRAES
jgi:hypothetical protein